MWNPKWQFDFSVNASEPVISAAPGQVIITSVTVDLIRGNPQPVTLVVATDWGSAGVFAQIIPPTVLPPSTATLNITVSPNTPPGSYMFAVRGDTQGTFASSEAMVTVVVTPNPNPNQQGGGGGQQNTPPLPPPPIPPSRRARPGRPAYPKKVKTVPQGKTTRGQKLVAATIVVAALLIAASVSGVFKDLGNLGGSNGTTASGTTTYYGTLVSCIGNECASGPTPYVQVDSSGDVHGPVIFGKITNGVFTGQANTADGVLPMAGTLSSDGTFTVHLNPLSSSHSWTWTMYRQ